MSFQWPLYIDVAQELLAVVPNQHAVSDMDHARLRAATSRAYYAAYNYCALFLEDRHQWKVPKADSHKELSDKLISFGKPLKYIGMALATLHTRRKDADYYLSRGAAFTCKDCQSSIQNAKKIIEDISKL